MSDSYNVSALLAELGLSTNWEVDIFKTDDGKLLILKNGGVVGEVIEHGAGVAVTLHSEPQPLADYGVEV